MGGAGERAAGRDRRAVHRTDRRAGVSGGPFGPRTGLGEAAVDAGAGGSIPFVTAYAGLFPHAEILITGVEDPGTRAHGANESLHLATFERACLAEALLLRNLAPLSARGVRRSSLQGAQRRAAFSRPNSRWAAVSGKL